MCTIRQEETGQRLLWGKEDETFALLLVGIGKLTKGRKEVFATKAKMEERARRAVFASMTATAAAKRASATLETAVKSRKRISALDLALNDAEALCAPEEKDNKKRTRSFSMLRKGKHKRVRKKRFG